MCYSSVHQRLLVARGCFARRLFRAVWQRSNPRRRAVIILIATAGGKRAAASCHFHHRPPRLRRRRPRSRPTRHKAGKKGFGGRETTPTAAPTAAQTPALPLPTRPIEPSLYPTAGFFNARDGWSSRVGLVSSRPVGSDDVVVFR